MWLGSILLCFQNATAHLMCLIGYMMRQKLWIAANCRSGEGNRKFKIRSSINEREDFLTYNYFYARARCYGNLMPLGTKLAIFLYPRWITRCVTYSSRSWARPWCRSPACSWRSGWWRRRRWSGTAWWPRPRSQSRSWRSWSPARRAWPRGARWRARCWSAGERNHWFSCYRCCAHFFRNRFDLCSLALI